MGRFAIKQPFHKMLLEYFQKNPVVGMITPVLATAGVSLSEMMTSDANIKVLGTVSLCLGILVAALTAAIKFIEGVEKVRQLIKKSKA